MNLLLPSRYNGGNFICAPLRTDKLHLKNSTSCILLETVSQILDLILQTVFMVGLHNILF